MTNQTLLHLLHEVPDPYQVQYYPHGLASTESVGLLRKELRDAPPAGEICLVSVEPSQGKHGGSIIRHYLVASIHIDHGKHEVELLARLT